MQIDQRPKFKNKKRKEAYYAHFKTLQQARHHAIAYVRKRSGLKIKQDISNVELAEKLLTYRANKDKFKLVFKQAKKEAPKKKENKAHKVKKIQAVNWLDRHCGVKITSDLSCEFISDMLKLNNCKDPCFDYIHARADETRRRKYRKHMSPNES